MVAFALERANPDILLFMMVLAAGLLAEGQLAVRLLGYGVALLAARPPSTTVPTAIKSVNAARLIRRAIFRPP